MDLDGVTILNCFVISAFVHCCNVEEVAGSNCFSDCDIVVGGLLKREIIELIMT